MDFVELDLLGAHLVGLDPIEDARGANARVWCRREFERAGLVGSLAQVNLIVNRHAGTIRGFHYQAPPRAEAKLFRVTRGRIVDVIVDLRPESDTFGEWTSVELAAGDPWLLFVPERFGQAFQTLDDDTELMYFVSEFYTPDSGRGFRHDDPALGVSWPLPATTVSEKDASWPDLDLARVADELRPADVPTIGVDR